MATTSLFLEIFPKEKIKEFPQWQIMKKPRQAFELRLIVWSAIEVHLGDSEMIDIKVTAKLGNFLYCGENYLSTDTHWRS